MSNEEKEMPLLGHIGELRKHLFRILIAIALFATAIGFNIRWVMDNVLLGPTRNDFLSIRWMNAFFKKIGLPNTQFTYNENFIIQQKELPEAFNLTIKIAVIGGFILAFPYIIFEIWRFVAPGLKPSEKKNSAFYLTTTSLLFFKGALFGYFIITPIAIQFFINFDISGQIEKIITISSVIKMVITSTLGMALMFLFPIISFVFSKMGVLTPDMLIKSRKQAFIVILIIGALITPSDIFSMFVAALPLLVLYEISILISKWVYRAQRGKEIS